MWCSVSSSAGIRCSALGASPPSLQAADCEESCGGPHFPARRCPDVSRSEKGGHRVSFFFSSRVLSSGPPPSASCCRLCGGSDPAQSQFTLPPPPPLSSLLSTPPSAYRQSASCTPRAPSGSTQVARVRDGSRFSKKIKAPNPPHLHPVKFSSVAQYSTIYNNINGKLMTRIRYKRLVLRL